MAITSSNAWKAAEFEYGLLQADLQMSPFLGRLSPEDIMGRLRIIVRRCPHYYPAVLELGVRLLAQKRHRGAEAMLERGFGIMIELADPEKAAPVIDGVVENLEKL
jgi:hypothetical protein